MAIQAPADNFIPLAGQARSPTLSVRHGRAVNASAGASVQALEPLRVGVRVRGLQADEVSNPHPALALVTVIEPGVDRSAAYLEHYLTQHRATLLQRLAEGGNVLFRGFDLNTAAFERLASQVFQAERSLWMLPFPPVVSRFLLQLPFVGPLLAFLLQRIEARATGRKLPLDKISTLPMDDTIQFPHHEFGIFFNTPQYIAFFCETGCQVGGETIISDGEKAWESLPTDLQTRFIASRGIRYKDQNTWWMPPFVAPALLKHPRTGAASLNFTGYKHFLVEKAARELFPEAQVMTGVSDETFQFNPQVIDSEGNRAELTEPEIEAIIRAHLEHSVLLKWQQGDLLLMDNFKCLHARLNSGRPRRTLNIVLGDYVWNR